MVTKADLVDDGSPSVSGRIVGPWSLRAMRAIGGILICRHDATQGVEGSGSVLDRGDEVRADGQPVPVCRQRGCRR